MGGWCSGGYGLQGCRVQGAGSSVHYVRSLETLQALGLRQTHPP